MNADNIRRYLKALDSVVYTDPSEVTRQEMEAIEKALTEAEEALSPKDREWLEGFLPGD
jgi:hypothetical protein